MTTEEPFSVNQLLGEIAAACGWQEDDDTIAKVVKEFWERVPPEHEETAARQLLGWFLRKCAAEHEAAERALGPDGSSPQLRDRVATAWGPVFADRAAQDDHEPGRAV